MQCIAERLGRLQVQREGKDVTLVAFGRAVGHLLEAAKQLDKDGISAEAWPLDVPKLPAQTLLLTRTQTVSGQGRAALQQGSRLPARKQTFHIPLVCWPPLLIVQSRMRHRMTQQAAPAQVRPLEQFCRCHHQLQHSRQH